MSMKHRMLISSVVLLLLHLIVAKPLFQNSTEELILESDEDSLFDFTKDDWWLSGNDADTYEWLDHVPFDKSECTKILDDVDDGDARDNSTTASHDEFMDVLDLPNPLNNDVHLSGTLEQNLWPNGIIRVDIDAVGRSLTLTRKLACAILFIETHSCLRFTRRQKKHTNYASITTNDDGCYSQHLGMSSGGGKQVLNLDLSSALCWRHGTIIHELMHLIGFFHEQAREDRNKFINIHWHSIPDAYKKQYRTASSLGFHQQLIGEYDYASVMHYPRFRNGHSNAVMSAIDEPVDQFNAAMGNRRYPTKEDARKINLLYSCNSIPVDAEEPRILLIGGLADDSSFTMEYYYPFSPKLSHILKAKMTQKRHIHTSALMDDGTVITVGGWANGFLSSCERFNPSTATVAQCPSLNNHRSWHASTVLNGVLHVCGGTAEGIPNIELKSCEKLLSDGWQTTVPMTIERSHLAMEAVNDFLYIIGGLDGFGIQLSSVERRRDTDDHWTSVSPMNHKRFGHSSTVMDGEIFVCGGFGEGSYLSSCEKYNPVDDLWVDIAQMNEERWLFGLVNDGNYTFALGGGKGQMVEIYDSGNNIWTVMQTQLIHRRLQFSAVYIASQKRE